MVDSEKQAARWRDGAREGLAVARELLDNGRFRQALFFAHLALEKALKAHVCRATRDLAPRSHRLLSLAQLAGLPVDGHQEQVLSEMTAFNLEGRYPESMQPPPTAEQAEAYFSRTQEVFEWLMQRL